MSLRIPVWVPLAVALAALGSAWWLVRPAPVTPLGPVDLGALAATAVVGELLPLPRSTGRAVPLSIAILGVAALLAAPPPQLAGLGVVAWGADAAVTATRGRHVRRFAVLPRTLGGWAMGGAAALGCLVLPRLAVVPASAGSGPGITWAAIGLVTVVVMIGLPAVDAAEASPVAGRGFTERLTELLRTSWMGGAALAASAAVGAISYLVLGWPALLLTLLPLLAARAGLRRYVDIRRTYDETVRAMSRLPEQVGGVPCEHGVRVAELATATGRLLELDRATLTALDRAAHLHELGRIRLDPGEQAPATDLARSGGDIVREADSLDEVATIIEQHRFASAEATPREALAADILRLACDLDSGVVAPGDRLRSTISVLARQVPHNPAVATAMARVIHGDAGALTDQPPSATPRAGSDP